jgi:hypothetical protein
MSWSVAAVPFVFWAMELSISSNGSKRATSGAAVVSCQALAGEPVTFVATFAIATAYATLPGGRWRDRRLVLLAAIGLGAGALLSAIQFVPLAAASRASMRGTGQMADMWAFHPLALVELAVPHFFGDNFNSTLREMGWVLALNSVRDPFYYTMYLGVPIILLAAVAACSGRRARRSGRGHPRVRRRLARGPHPVYPLLRELIPPLRSFRYPVKYLSLALRDRHARVDGVPVGAGSRRPRRAVRLVLTAAGGVALDLRVDRLGPDGAPASDTRVLPSGRVGERAVSDPGAGFCSFARGRCWCTLLKLLCASFLLGLAASSRRERRPGLMVFAVFVVVDLLASNSSVNPTMDASVLGSPAWVDQMPPGMHERVYVGGRLEGSVNTTDVDGPKYAKYFDGYTDMEQRSLIVGEFLMHTSGSRIRESMSYDLPMLWSTDFARAVGWFRAVPREERLRYLQASERGS